MDRMLQWQGSESGVPRIVENDRTLLGARPAPAHAVAHRPGRGPRAIPAGAYDAPAVQLTDAVPRREPI
jgi:hypothetical protein